jgi:hypothetical protein
MVAFEESAGTSSQEESASLRTFTGLDDHYGQAESCYHLGLIGRVIGSSAINARSGSDDTHAAMSAGRSEVVPTSGTGANRDPIGCQAPCFVVTNSATEPMTSPGADGSWRCRVAGAVAREVAY